ncbi:hypothetical protein GGR58DRAFT_203432 [Xylaria digitata]|nr:hypothetical protein GGR58DRAFT_203432 [Xylaria digitata]
MSDQPPPPPPHGTNPRRSSPNLPPGKYDIFIIPPHSSGAGFLYLPSMKPNVNSFAAGFASALVLVVLFQSLAPAFRVWYNNFQGMGNAGMLLLVIAVGVGAWALGRMGNEGSQSSGTRGDSRHSWSYNPGDNGHSGGPHSSAGPPPHSRAPDPDGPPPPPPPHGTPPPRSGPSPSNAGAEKPRSSWQERPQEHAQERPQRPRERPRERSQERPRERPRERSQERPQQRPRERSQERPRERSEEQPRKQPREQPREPPREQPQELPKERPRAESTKGSWERAREETRRKEEERKAKEAEQRKKEEIARRIKELREKEARERAKREQEAMEKREKEAREKEKQEQEIRERLEREARIREEREREIREKLEREARIREEREREARERAEKAAREAREKQEKEMREAREREEKEAREKEQREKEQREREQQEKEKARREKELREKRLQEARERELRERLEREKSLRAKLEQEVKEREAKEREAKEREAKEREAKEREANEREAARLKEVEAAKAAEEAKVKEAETTRRSTYAFSSVGERTNPWPNGKPPTQAPSPTKSTATPSVAPTATPSAASTSTRRPPPPTAQSFRGADDDAYSYHTHSQPKSHARRRSGETIFTESSYAPSQSTSRTTPPPSVRGPYSTKDPDKIVIKAVYGFLNQFSKTPASQLLSGVGNVTDGLILRITTEGLFIDDDVRGVPQREWDVKAWTLKLMEVWCPAHTTADSNASPRVTNKPMPPRFKFSARGQSKALMGDDADAYLTELLHACKDDCRMGPHSGLDTASSRGTSQVGDWKQRGLHVLRATIRDQEGKRFLFVLGEEEGWKVAVGLQRLRKGTQIRQLGVQPMPLTEARGAVETLGW